VGTGAGRQSAAAAVARQWQLQRKCKRFTGMWGLGRESAQNGKIGGTTLCVKEYFVKQWCHGETSKDGSVKHNMKITD
jgi:hypothetical protein